MIMIVVAVRDRVANVFGQPHYVLSVGGAIRAFGDEINRQAPDNQFSKHPMDYDLFQLGTFDDHDGSFACGTPKQLAIGKDLVIK